MTLFAPLSLVGYSAAAGRAAANRVTQRALLLDLLAAPPQAQSPLATKPPSATSQPSAAAQKQSLAASVGPWLAGMQAMSRDLWTVTVALGHEGLTSFQQLRKEAVAVFVDEGRRNQQTVLTADAKESDDTAIQPPAAKVDSDLAICLLGIGLSGAGNLFFPPLSLLSVPCYLYEGMYTYRQTYAAARQKRVTVDTMITVILIGATVSGYFFTANLSGVLFILSRRLMTKVKSDSQRSMVDIFRQHPRSVWVIEDGVEVETPFAALAQGDVVVVHAGEMVAVDGIVLEGTALLDQQILTGEARPVEKTVGDSVFASTITLTGYLKVRVEKTGEATTVAQIGEMLNQTTDYKATQELRAETLADKTVLPTLLLSAVALPLVGIASATGIIAAHFMNLMNIVAPISILNFFNVLSKRHILVKDGRVLDLLTQVDTIVFDKTGTLTTDQPQVIAIYGCAEMSEEMILSYAAAAEQRQTHPLARAIRDAAAQRLLTVPNLDDATYKPGYGLSVLVNQQQVQIGSERFMVMEGIDIPATIQQQQTKSHQAGHMLVFVALDQRLIGVLELAPTVRPEAAAVVQALRQRSQIKATYIISGDHEAPTRQLAQALGIDDYFAEVLPDQKANLVEQLQTEGKFICYIGDGINDAIALKKAQVSVSLRGASTVATDTAQVILMDGTLQQLVPLFDLAQDFQRNINLCFALILIPSAIGMGGALFGQFNLFHTLIIKQVGLFGGIGCAMVPIFKHRRVENSADFVQSQQIAVADEFLYPGAGEVAQA